MDIEKVLDKIKKCLALSKSSNEYEAAQALKHAHALMKKYQIDNNDIAKSEINSAYSKSKAGLVGWHFLLIGVIEQVFCVSSFFDYDSAGNRVVRWNGYGKSVELAQYTYDVLFRQCNKARTQYIKESLKRVKKRANKTVRANAYAEGWASAVYSIVYKFVTVEEKEKRNKIKEIVTKDMNLVPAREANRELDNNLKNYVETDRLKGLRDGKEVNLFRPVDSNTSQLAIE